MGNSKNKNKNKTLKRINISKKKTKWVDYKDKVRVE
jgi:hypothetical protein